MSRLVLDGHMRNNATGSARLTFRKVLVTKCRKLQVKVLRCQFIEENNLSWTDFLGEVLSFGSPEEMGGAIFLTKPVLSEPIPFLGASLSVLVVVGI